MTSEQIFTRQKYSLYIIYIHHHSIVTQYNVLHLQNGRTGRGVTDERRNETTPKKNYYKSDELALASVEIRERASSSRRRRVVWRHGSPGSGGGVRSQTGRRRIPLRPPAQVATRRGLLAAATYGDGGGESKVRRHGSPSTRTEQGGSRPESP